MKKTDSSYNHILKYTSIFGGVQGLNILIGLVRNKLVALILGPEGMGLVALFNSTIRFVSDSTNLGISMSAVKNISEYFEEGNEVKIRNCVCTIRSLSLITAILGMLVCVVFSPLLNKWAFSWGDHTLHFVLLSPIVAMMSVTGGETAIIKGVRQLGKLAKIQLYTVVAALIFTVPIYYYYGQSGIVPSLVVIAMSSMFITVFYSYKLYPIQISVSLEKLRESSSIIKLGVAFVLAGVMNSGADFIVRSYLNNTSSLITVGLYNAGYMITMTYAGMVFSAMETDYFPRLSAVRHDIIQQNLMVNRQIEVSLLIISPMLVVMMISLPLLLPLLYSGKFLPVLGMTQICMLAMFIRVVKLPVAYISLAKGDSKSFLLLESLYDISFVLLVIFGFENLGLTGVGIAITTNAVLEMLLLFTYMHWKYDYNISTNVLRYMLYQFPIGILAYMVTFVRNGAIYWILGIVLIALSTMISLYILHQKTHLWDSLKKKIVGH